MRLNALDAGSNPAGPIKKRIKNDLNHNSIDFYFHNRNHHQHQAQGLTMHFIKLGKRYINLDAVAAILPKENGLCYTINFIGHQATMDICEMDMVDIKKALDMAATTRAAINEINTIASLDIPPKQILEMFKGNKPLAKEQP